MYTFREKDSLDWTFLDFMEYLVDRGYVLEEQLEHIKLYQNLST